MYSKLKSTVTDSLPGVAASAATSSTPISIHTHDYYPAHDHSQLLAVISFVCSFTCSFEV